MKQKSDKDKNKELSRHIPINFEDWLSEQSIPISAGNFSVQLPPEKPLTINLGEQLNKLGL